MSQMAKAIKKQNLQYSLFDTENYAKEDFFSDNFYGFKQSRNWFDRFGLNLRETVKFTRRPKILSLFSGAGGLDIGFFDAGFDIVEKVELEEKFVETLKCNSSVKGYYKNNSKVTCIDIAKYHPNHTEIDFIIGGPPCQSFSAAGARASGVSGTRAERGKLFHEYVRILKQVKPLGFLFENVYRIVGSNSGRDWKDICQAFTAAGYKIDHRILDTADYGVPQHRERLIIIGLRTDIAENTCYKFPRPTHGYDAKTGLKHYSARKAIEDVVAEPVQTGIGGKYGHLLEEIPPGLNYSFFTEKMGHPTPVFAWRSKFSDFLYKADPEKPVRTIKAQGGQYTGPFHWSNRTFTINELKRLQTFPDEYKIVGGRLDRIKQIGNSVPPQFARILALSVAEQLFNANIPLNLDYLEFSEELSFRKRKRELTNHYKAISKNAIKLLNLKKSKISLLSYRANLNTNLSWVESNNGAVEIDEKIEEGKLYILLNGVDTYPKNNSFKLKIAPTDRWSLPFNEVIIISDTYSDQLYTSAWKAFESFLSRNSLKADLVQLSGYYQYKCSFKCNLEIKHSNDTFINILSEITKGVEINKHLDKEHFERKYNIARNQIVLLLERFKKMGFEIRNHLTNPAITKGYFLIPYCFPTMNENSVQRTKSLLDE